MDCGDAARKVTTEERNSLYNWSRCSGTSEHKSYADGLGARFIRACRLPARRTVSTSRLFTARRSISEKRASLLPAFVPVIDANILL